MEMWAKCLPRIRACCLFHRFSDNLWSIPRGIYDANDACISSTLIVHSAPIDPFSLFLLILRAGSRLPNFCRMICGSSNEGSNDAYLCSLW